MSVPFDYHPVGLGLAFQQQPEVRYTKTPALASQARFDDQQFTDQRSFTGDRRPQLQHNGGIYHHRSQSAVVPQRAVFDPSFYQMQAPRSAQPLQQPFNVMPAGYTHSAPTTPIHEMQHAYSFQHAQTEHHDTNREKTLRDRRQQRKRPDMRPPPPQPQYYSSPRFMEQSAPYPGRTRADESPSSNGSYFHMTPQVQSTPYSDAGHFSMGEPYGNHSTAFNTPQFGTSPVFEGYQGNDGPRFSDEPYTGQTDDMPEGPYIPPQRTNFPPLRPQALRPSHSFEQDPRLISSDIEDNSHFSSSSPSPPSTPQQKDRKVAYSRWTSVEDLLLKDAISKHGDGKWSLVSQLVPGRTPMQCSTRWQGALNTTIHKGRWDLEEDAILIKAVADWQAWHLSDAQHQTDKRPEEINEEMYKNIPWSNIAQLLPRPRTGVQALARWSEALDPRITKGKWTGTEDSALLKGVSKYGKCWIKIANGVKGRTQRQCRTRYCQISDKKRKVRGGPVKRTTTGSPEDVSE